MKKNILNLFSILSLSLATFTANAQDVLLSSDFVQFDFTSIDLTDNFQDLYDYITVTNNTNETIELKWERIVVLENTQEEWQSQICDNNLCYGFNTSTNYDPDNGLDAPFILGPGESFAEFALHVWPRMTEGCGQYKIRFSRTSAPDEILAVAHFDVSVNKPDCVFLSSTEEQEALADVVLYPNPTTNQFNLSNNDVVKSLTIFNILGKQMKHINYFNGDAVDVADLADGMYLVALHNEDGQTLKTLRLSKRGLRP